MQQACEVCGTVLHSPPIKVEMDGAIMLTCGRCAKLGRPIGGALGKFQLTPMQAAMRTTSSIEPEYELEPEYHLKIRQAREKMTISQEDLGKMINEKPSVIKLVETRKLKPDPVLTRKLMHYLKINILVPVSELERR